MSSEMSPVSLLLLLVFATGNAQLIQLGRCPEVDIKRDFLLNEYLGTWYQHASFGTTLFQGVGRCVTAVYSLNSTSSHVVDVYNIQIPLSPRAMSSIRGSAILEDPNTMKGKLKVTFPIKGLGFITSPYWVLETDYESWALVFSCLDLRFAHISSGWILTRARRPDDHVEMQVSAALARANLSRAMFINTNQTDCQVVEKIAASSQPHIVNDI